ncbi:MAG: amidase [Rhodospirillales bacterium]|nr:amidase [Rhodospirillales bacterium]
MPAVPPEPLAAGLAEFAQSLRAGRTTSEAVTRAYLARIAAYDGRIQAYEHVASERALAQARAMDALLAAGTDLGPLMGVPIGIKDILAVDGMRPATSGSAVDVADLVGDEGPFVKALKRAGVVILGKLKTAEFAIGRGGINTVRGTPWNPWDSRVHRLPGGSSSGSGAAQAAGLCGFAIGTDTAGSIRLPAALSGVVGLKTAKGLWSTDGVFPLSPSLDTVGVLTRSAADAAFIFAALTGGDVAVPAAPRGLRLGRPGGVFEEEMDPEVRSALEAVVDKLKDAGVEIVAAEIPDATTAGALFGDINGPELVAGLGRDRIAQSLQRMDPFSIVAVEHGIKTEGDRYVRQRARHAALVRQAPAAMAGIDAWITPTLRWVSAPVASVSMPGAGGPPARVLASNTLQANLLGLCATTSPIQGPGAPLPIGLQVIAPAFAETKALGIARLIERLVGLPPQPDLAGFLAAS